MWYANWETEVPNQSALKANAFVTSSYRAQEEQNKGDIVALPIGDQDAVDTLLDTLTSVAANIEAITNSRVDESLINEIRRRPLGPPPGAPGPAARVALPVRPPRPLDPEGPELPPAGASRGPGRDWFGRPFPEEKEELPDYGSAAASDIRAGSRDELSRPSLLRGVSEGSRTEYGSSRGALSRLVPSLGAPAVSEGSRTLDAYPPLAPRTRARIDEFDVDPDEIPRRSEMGYQREDADRLRKLGLRKLQEEEEGTTSEPFVPDIDPRSAYLAEVYRSPARRAPATPEPRIPETMTSPFLSGAPAASMPTMMDYERHFAGMSVAAVGKEAAKLNKAGYSIDIPPPRERTEANSALLLREVAASSMDADQRYFEAKGSVRPYSAFAEGSKPRRVVKGKTPQKLSRQVTLEKEGESVGAGMCGGAMASALPTSAKVGTLIDRALRMLKKLDFRTIPNADLDEIKAITDHIRSMVIVPGRDPALMTIQDKVAALLTQLDVKLASNRSLFQVKTGSGFGYMPAASTSEYIGPVMEAMPRRYC